RSAAEEFSELARGAARATRAFLQAGPRTLRGERVSREGNCCALQGNGVHVGGARISSTGTPFTSSGRRVLKAGRDLRARGMPVMPSERAVVSEARAGYCLLLVPSDRKNVSSERAHVRGEWNSFVRP